MLRCVRTETTIRGTEGRALEDSPVSTCTAGGKKSPFNGSQLSAAAPARAKPSRGIKIWHYYGYYAVIINHPPLPPFQHRQTVTHANSTRMHALLQLSYDPIRWIKGSWGKKGLKKKCLRSGVLLTRALRESPVGSH